MEFPYPPRTGQRELVDAIRDAHRRHTHLVAEAATGTGKTICALTGSLGDQPVIYATRTNSQQEQVLQEHQALRASGQDPGLAVPFMGRRHYCPLLKDDERFQDGTPEELGRLCQDAKRKAIQQRETGRPVRGACKYYARLLDDGPGPVEALLEAGCASTAALATQVSATGSCPYEALKMLLPQAALVIVPSVFVIDDRLRATLLEWLGISADQARLVVDEAHHLPEAIRAHHSPRLGLGTLERALKEAEEIGDPTLAGRTLATEVVMQLHALVRELADEHAGENDDGWLPHDEATECLMVRLGAPGPALERIALEMEDWGEAIRERRREQGKLPRSYFGAVGSFLRFWMAPRDAPYVHLVVREPRPALEAYLLDPAAKCRFLRDLGSSVHLSGTLAPVAAHAQLLGLPQDARCLVQASPFDPERLRIYGVHGVRRQPIAAEADPAILERQQQEARTLLQAWSGRIGLFFPSHQMMADAMEEGLLHGLDAAVFQERQGMSQSELLRLLDDFMGGVGRRVLVGVLGGRLTEGIDYPGNAMEHMLLMGIPYPRPSARSQALIHHFDRVDGCGWQRAVHDPTGRTLRQAVGRLIRGPKDQGTAVVLDDRAVRFRDHLPRLRMVKDAAGCRDDPAPQQEGFRAANRLSPIAD